MNTKQQKNRKWHIRWDLLLRYRLIEIIALWEGRLTTNHLCDTFGIGRQQASKDINTYLADIAPGNLVYDKQLKGYKPAKTFCVSTALINKFTLFNTALIFTNPHLCQFNIKNAGETE